MQSGEFGPLSGKVKQILRSDDDWADENGAILLLG